jgi:hypothetical protein
MKKTYIEIKIARHIQKMEIKIAPLCGNFQSEASFFFNSQKYCGCGLIIESWL